MVNKGAIRSLERFAQAAARRRTERFDHCFPRGITMGDIDSHVEINHHWLFIEYKTGNQALSTGQRLDLERLAARPRMSVWIIWTTEDGFITHGQRLGFHKHRTQVTEEQVAQRIKEWVIAAEAAEKPSPIDIALVRLNAVIYLDSLKSRILQDAINGLTAEIGATE